MVFCEMSVLDGQAGIGLMLLSMCFFKFLHELLGLLTVPQFVLLKARQNAYYLFRWRNLVVSFSHALCTGIGTIVWSDWNFYLYRLPEVGVCVRQVLLCFLVKPCCFKLALLCHLASQVNGTR